MGPTRPSSVRGNGRGAADSCRPGRRSRPPGPRSEAGRYRLLVRHAAAGSAKLSVEVRLSESRYGPWFCLAGRCVAVKPAWACLTLVHSIYARSIISDSRRGKAYSVLSFGHCWPAERSCRSTCMLNNCQPLLTAISARIRSTGISTPP